MDQVARALVTIAMVAITAPAGSAVPAADPNLYLEQVDGARALTTVKAWNAATLAKLEKQPGFADYRAKALALLSTNQKIAEPDAILGDKVLNYWQDEQHPRGIWRVSPLAAFAAGKPQWRTLLDIDAMSKADGKQWAFKGASCLSPAYVDCMVSLSNGGGDAVEVREFDLDKAAFIAGGFSLPTAKTDVSWASPDSLFELRPGHTHRLRLCARCEAVEAQYAAFFGCNRFGRHQEGRGGPSDDPCRRKPDVADPEPRGRFLSS